MNELTCAEAGPLLGDLLVGALEPASAGRLERHLSECAACRQHCLDLLLQDRILTEMAAQEQLDPLLERIRDRLTRGREPVEDRAVKQRRRRLVALAALAAGITAVLLAVWWLRPAPPVQREVLVRLESFSGEVFVLTVEGGKVQAEVGQELHPGDGLEVGEDSSAAVVCGEGVRLEVGPETVLRWPVPGPGETRRVLLVEGGLTMASRVPRDAGLIVQTEHAEVTTTDSLLTVWSDPEGTHLELEEGRAQVVRRADGRSVAIEPGTSTTVAPTADQAPQQAPQPLPPRLQAPRLRLTADEQKNVTALAVARNGKTVAVGQIDGSVRLWDLTSGEQVRWLGRLGKPIRTLAFSHDSSFLAVGGEEKQLVVWEVATGRTHFQQGLPPLYALAWGQDDRVLLSAGWQRTVGRNLDRVVRRFDGATGKVVTKTRLPAPDGEFVVCMAFHRTSLVAEGNKANQARVWDTTTGEVLGTFPGHQNHVTAVTFSPDGAILATGSQDKTVRLWDVSPPRKRAVLHGHRHTINCLAFAQGGHTLASGSTDGTVRLWDVESGQERTTIKGHQQPVQALTWTPNGRTLLSGDATGLVLVWDAAALEKH
jgi:ferric-dicitrate binding protein FerR (iron transport regulator)